MLKTVLAYQRTHLRLCVPRIFHEPAFSLMFKEKSCQYSLRPLLL